MRSARTWSGTLLEQASLLTLGLHRALGRAGCDDREATHWVSEATWAGWSAVSALPWALARLRARTPEDRLARTVAATRRFLAPPDFGVQAAPGDPTSFAVTRCPMRDVFAAEGQERVCAATFCALDHRLAASRGLVLARRGTLASGAPCCDFAWSVEGEGAAVR